MTGLTTKPFHGKVMVFTAPSGAGKTTIVQHLLATYPDELSFSVSATSRTPRDGEIHGVDYYFLSQDQFQEKIDKGAFLEWEEVYPGQCYGTLLHEIDRIWSVSKHIIFDVDVKGATNIKNHFNDHCLAIFIRPPSLQVLADRLRKRATESTNDLRRRISRVKGELTYENNFDKVLVNDILEVALKEAEMLVEEFLVIDDQ